MDDKKELIPEEDREYERQLRENRQRSLRNKKGQRNLKQKSERNMKNSFKGSALSF